MMVSAAITIAGSPFSTLSISRRYTSRHFSEAVCSTYSYGDNDLGRFSSNLEGMTSTSFRPSYILVRRDNQTAPRAGPDVQCSAGVAGAGRPTPAPLAFLAADSEQASLKAAAEEDPVAKVLGDPSH